MEHEIKTNDIQLGLCCLNTILRKENVFCSRKPILKTINSKGLEFLQEKCIENCKDLIKMIEWNNLNGIRVFRISSELFPHYNNPKSDIKYSLDFAQPLLTIAGNLAKKYNMRLTFHPGQYNVIASPNLASWEKTVLDLDMHGEILDRLGCDIDSVLVIHGGGIYGDKEKTKLRWVERYGQLPERVQRRLVLENCEKCFSIVDCLEISKKCGVPVVFDTHHFDCYKILHPDITFLEAKDYISDILATWELRGIKPKFHVSEQCCDARGKSRIGKHSDYIDNIPHYLLEIPKKYNIQIDIMIEAKMKEQAIYKLYEKYPHLDLREPKKKIKIIKKLIES